MRPAYSVIFFTVASGAGYGLIAWLGIAAALGLSPGLRGVTLAGLALAVLLVTAGLLSSSAHLGRPERAWRAFSQWRTSWLSREGVAAVATYLPVALLALALLLPGRTRWAPLAGLVGAAGAIATVVATSMIYASLKPVREWRQPLVPLVYLLHAAMTGALLAATLVALFGAPSPIAIVLALSATVIAALAKTAWWRAIDRPQVDAPTLATATGLIDGGAIRSMQWPHSERNYLLKEMGYRVARKHARRLRRIALVFAYLLPLLLAAAALAVPAVGARALLMAAALLQLAGLLVERWLFFAEATHTVTLYYGYGDLAWREA